MTRLLDGKTCAAYIEEKIRNELASMQCSRAPHLHVISVGNDAASAVYMRQKQKACERVGFKYSCLQLKDDATQEMVVDAIWNGNTNNDIDGVIVQLPLPPNIDIKEIQSEILRWKDVDGFRSDSLFKPCTPLGVMTLLKYYGYDVKGKNCVVLGRSNIVGKPLAKKLLDAGATVAVCHSKTPIEVKKELIRHADFIFSAVGKPNVVTADDMKPSTRKPVLVDIGINRNPITGKLCGDFEKDCYELCSAYTPVPGGIGPMTVSSLLVNTLNAFKKRKMKPQIEEVI